MVIWIPGPTAAIFINMVLWRCCIQQPGLPFRFWRTWTSRCTLLPSRRRRCSDDSPVRTQRTKTGTWHVAQRRQGLVQRLRPLLCTWQDSEWKGLWEEGLRDWRLLVIFLWFPGWSPKIEQGWFSSETLATTLCPLPCPCVAAPRPWLLGWQSCMLSSESHRVSFPPVYSGVDACVPVALRLWPALGGTWDSGGMWEGLHRQLMTEHSTNFKV